MVKRSNWSIPYLVFMLVFVVLPLLLIVLYAFQDSAGHFTFSNITHFFSDSDSLSTFAVSIEVAIENTLICILLGYPAAWILANRKYNRSAVTVVLFLIKDKIGKWAVLAWSVIWFIAQFMSHELVTITGNGYENKTHYFEGAVKWLEIDGEYVPDVYHTVLHILILAVTVTGLVYVFGRKKPEEAKT